MLAGGSVRAYKRELLALLNADKLTEEEDAGLLRKVRVHAYIHIHVRVCICLHRSLCQRKHVITVSLAWLR